MTEYVSLDNALQEAAMIVVGNDAVECEPRAFAALRHAGFSTKFVAAMWSEIQSRAREIDGTFGYSRHIVFLNAHAGTVH